MSRLYGSCGFGCLIAAVSIAGAQPTEFFDLGVVQAPATPPSYSEFLPLNGYELFQPGDPINVKWIRFEIVGAISSPLFLDIDSRLYPDRGLPFGLTYALFNSQGDVVAVDDSEGSFPDDGGAAGLSFGSNAPRNPVTFDRLLGQDGDLQSGVYWLALAAGKLGTTTVGQSGWFVTSTRTYTYGMFEPGTHYLEIAAVVGNTVALPPPANDRCTNSIVVGENIEPGVPAWSGSNAGASGDAQFPCYLFVPGREAKDIWFTYIPSATGVAEVIVRGGAGGAVPMIDRYDGLAGCGSQSLQCVGGSSFGVDSETRMTFEVTAGVPVLLAVGVRAGATYPLQLNINLIPPPCTLNVPSGAMHESESVCGQDMNGGCNVTPFAFDSYVVGDVMTGELFSGATLRDTDWFRFTVDCVSQIELTFASQMPIAFAVFAESTDPQFCPGEGKILSGPDGYGNICGTKSLQSNLDPGEYVMVVLPEYFDELPCGGGYERYWYRIDATPLLSSCRACLADHNQDGGVDSDDVISFFGAWDRGGQAADVNQDGGVDSDDVITFFSAWDAGC